MSNSKTSIHVPFTRKIIDIYLKVDKWPGLLILVFALGSYTGHSQNEAYVDSLSNVYINLEDGKSKIKLSHQLFKLTIHKNKVAAKTYADEQLALSKQIKYTKGEGTAYRDLAYYYQFLPLPDSARYYFKKSVKNFKINGNKERQCTALDRFAVFEIKQGNYEIALGLVKEIEALAKKLKNGKILTDALQRQSVVYLDMANYALAMDAALQSIKVADTMTPKNTLGKALGLSDVGRIEIHRNNYQAALEPTKEALKILEALGESKLQSIVLNQLGNAYWYLKNYDESLKAYQESLDQVTSINRQDYMAVAMANMASIYSKKGEYNKAIEMIENAQATTLKIGTMGNIINNYGILGDIHLENEHPLKAANNYTKAIHIADSINAIDDLYSMYKGRSEAFENGGNYKNALNDYKAYKKLYDSIFSTKSNKNIENLKAKYETEKKEKMLLIIENKIKLLEERKQKAENQRLFFVITSIGILLFALSLFYGLRQKLKRNKVEREKLDNDLEFKEKELTTHALHLAHKNEVLLDLKSQLKELKSEGTNSRSYQKAINTINLDINNDSNWKQFKNYFEDVHKDFNSKVMRNYPEVSNNDLRLMSLLKMNLSSKEIANILNISIEGVKKARYRLRKKLNLTTEESLQELVIEL